MKLTETMVRDFVTTTKSVEEIGDLLTMTGFEIEDIVEVEGEPVLDVNIMANRGDGASVLGLAREILAKDPDATPTRLYSELTHGLNLGDEASELAASLATVRIETRDCTRYALRVFEGLDNGESPGWIQERLRKVGQRPISLLVDLTNYVMLETGQPTHAFDLDKLGSKVVVRQALPGERLKTLDGTEHELRAGQMMICDEGRPVAVAGVMGGEDTEVSRSTTRCLLESAHFDHQSVRRTRKQLGLQTDASYRFERYVDPEGVVRALNRFASLLEEATGCKPVPGVVDVYPHPPVRKPVRVRPDRCSRLLGTPVTSAEVALYLTKLGSSLEPEGDGFNVTPPTWRIDLEREDDYVEEVGRVHGYERIPEALPIGSTPVGGVHGAEAVYDRIREELLRCGLDQAISHSLRDKHPLDTCGGRTKVRNPHSPELAFLRNSVLPCLADTTVRNGGKDVQLFEIGRVFGEGRESVQLGILCQGAQDPVSWQGLDRGSSDFYMVKGVVERCLRAARVECGVKPFDGYDPRFHPTRQAEVAGLGVFGQIHPDLAEQCGLAPDTVIAELDLTKAASLVRDDVASKPLHRNPAARRDIAVLVSKAVPYSTIEAAIKEACGEVLEHHWLFDVYAGVGIEPGFHSLAIGLQFRKAGNFTDEEANRVRDLAVEALERLGARLR